MATIMYRTGNGYHCGCCRQTWADTFDFETAEEAVSESISIARGSDWDFSIDRIFGFMDEDSNADELEERIMEAIKQAEKDHDKQREITRLQDQIKAINKWFATLEQQKAEKNAEVEKLLKKLEEVRNG